MNYDPNVVDVELAPARYAAYLIVKFVQGRAE